MPIRQIFYSGRMGSDIHLLRGDHSRDLRVGSLAFVPVRADGTDAPGQWAKSYLDAHTGADEDVTLRFRPTFKAGLVGDEWTGLGIKVNQLTGVVSFEAGPPPNPTAANFIIEAVITQNDGGIPPAEIQPARIRVHVHTAVTRIWLTPDPLTVRRLTAAGAEDTRYRFTVRAEFADGTVGDVTTGHGVTWGPAANVYTSVDGEVGLLRIPAGVAAGAVEHIHATWTTSAGTKITPDADMVVAAPWASDPAMPKAHLVEGHPDTWAGTINPEVVPNVLFFGDGFSNVAADQAAFEAITQKLAHDLKKDPLTTPYDRLATSMNYWRVAVPSTSRGISARCEVFIDPLDAALFAFPVPPALPPPDAGVWKVEHLIYASGLPLPADVPPAGEGPVQATARRGALRARWALIARTSVVPAILSDAVIDQWAQIGSRTFIDEIDAFPAMGLGAPPAADQQSDIPLLLLHPDRGGDAVLEAFYRALGAANNVVIAGPGPGNNLGIVWAEDRPAFHFDNRSLVVALSAFEGGRAQRTARHIDLSLHTGNNFTRVTAVAGRKAVAIDQTVELAVTVEREVWRTIAHELGHSFGLGDEYVDLKGRFTAPEATLDTWGNLTSETAVQSGTQFRAAQVKWNWRRARKAAVVRAPIVPPTGPEFDIKVGVGQAFQFAAGDKVRLRARQRKKVLGRDPVECSSDLEVVSRNAAGDVLTVRGSPSVLELTFFLEGSVVYIPVPMPDGAAGEARLIAPKVAKFIEDENRPLTAWPCDPAAHLGLDAQGRLRGSLRQFPAFDTYPPLWSHRNDVRVVGLYAGGARLGCGIYHPAGLCMMRNAGAPVAAGVPAPPPAPAPGAGAGPAPKEGANPFCAVCKFVMVEYIDPGQHWWIDRLYDASYPG